MSIFNQSVSDSIILSDKRSVDHSWDDAGSLLTDITAFWALNDPDQSSPPDTVSFVDSVGSNNLTIPGTFNYTAKPGLVGNGFDYDFNSGGSSVSIDLTTSLASTLFSVSFWAKSPLFSSTVFSLEYFDVSSNLHGILIILNIDGNVTIEDFNFSNGTFLTWTFNCSNIVTGYNHVILTYDNGSVFKIYVNGVDTGTETTGSPSPNWTRDISRWGFSQSIDAIGWWGRTLNFDDVALLYNNGHGIEYPFDGQNINDLLGFEEIAYANIKAGIVSDTITLSDTNAAHGPTSKSLSDTVTFSEVVRSSAGPLRQFFEVINFTDSVSTTTPWHLSVNDTITFGDSVNNHIFDVSVADFFFPRDSVTYRDGTFREIITDNLVFNDSIILGQPKYTTASDTIIIQDTIFHYTPYHVAISDSIQLTDNTQVHGPIFANASDSIAFNETWTNFNLLTIIDTVTFIEKIKTSPNIEVNVLDTINLQEIIKNSQPHFLTVIDKVTLTEIIKKNSVSNILVVDCINIYDKGNRTYNESLSDSISLTDVAEAVIYYEVTDQLILTDDISIPLDFTNLCHTDVIKLNSPLIKDKITFTDVSASGGDRGILVAQTITIHDFVVGFKINTSGR